MKQALVLFGLVAVASAAWKGGLRAHFAYGLTPGKDSFYDLPRTVEDAKTAGYTLQTRPSGQYLPDLVMYCPSPAELCVLYDDTEYVAGLQVGVIKSEFENYFDLATMGMTEWSSDDGTEFWTIAEYFVSEEFLATDSKTRVAARDSTTVLQADAVWLTGTNGEIVEAPRDIDNIGQTKFLKEACMPWMGLHYYYNMSTTTECTAEGIFPWFPMYDDGTLIGVGFMNFGKYVTHKDSKNWFEVPGKTAVQVIVPSAPQCLYDLSETPGALTMHTYFVNEPWLVTCLRTIFG